MQIVAAVARERAGSFSIEKLDLADPRPDELLVRIVASGMCQTDLHGRDGYYNTPLPAVFGHEGAGVVAAVGTSVTNFAVGDHVVLSFPWCSTCANCKRQMEFHCQNNFELKMRGTRPDGSTLMSQGGAPVYGAFFQQSSFATYAIANERFAVKVRKDAPLELLGPFACSGQTGAGRCSMRCNRERGTHSRYSVSEPWDFLPSWRPGSRAAIRSSPWTSMKSVSCSRVSSARRT